MSDCEAGRPSLDFDQKRGVGEMHDTLLFSGQKMDFTGSNPGFLVLRKDLWRLCAISALDLLRYSIDRSSKSGHPLCLIICS